MLELISYFCYLFDIRLLCSFWCCCHSLSEFLLSKKIFFSSSQLRRVESSHNMSAKACFNCGEEGHIKAACPQGSRGGGSRGGRGGGSVSRGRGGRGGATRKSPENSKCRECGKVGHFRRNCPDLGDEEREKVC